MTLRPPTTQLQGWHPQSWGASAVPPGGPFLASTLATADAPASNPQWTAGSESNWYANWCYGIWPDNGGQSTYQNDCYGHDEPGIQFYSTIPGSGGNVTWNVTLPTDRSATQNQSDLYSAIWFGMTLNDPFAWMNQCFLELQFYPDSSWYAPAPSPLNLNFTVPGLWVGAAVAWQIEAATGIENPCFYEPLYLNGNPGPAFLNMTQGDRISVTMSGFSTSTSGELLSVNDVTQGTSSTLNLFNQSCSNFTVFQGLGSCGGNYPLNPSYSTNSFENALQWTPGGEYPVVFAFETGHAGNPSFPSDNPFGGCSPGGPTPTGSNPATPCPSYDPGSWTNDTATPWQIASPVFFNANARGSGVQVGFSQDLGGISFTAGQSSLYGSFSFGCDNRVGGSYCSYPWYSYSCTDRAFEFGATDYPGVTDDFGKYNQYATSFQINGADYAFYPPTNFSTPTCGGPSGTVTVGASAGGAAYFLSQAYTTATAVPNLALGVYSLHAMPQAGQVFTGWTTTGAASVNIATSAWASLTVDGSGSVTAHFASTGTLVRVQFNDSSLGGTVVVSSGLLRAMPPATTHTLSSGVVLSLAPGIYNIEGMPPMGYNFTSWSVSGGAAVAASGFPYTYLVVTGATANVYVTANSAPSGSFALVYVYGFGNGTVYFNGTAANYYPTFNESFSVFFMPTGSYLAQGIATPGWSFLRWFPGGNSVFSDFYNSTVTINVEEGFDYFYAVFGNSVVLRDVPSTGGMISFNGGFPSPNGTTVQVRSASYYENVLGFTPYFPIQAAPTGGYSFLRWVGAPSANFSFIDPFSSESAVLILGSGTIGAVFATNTNNTVGFVVSPVGSGSILFNYEDYAGGDSNSSIANGTYLVVPIPAPGYQFSGWVTFPYYVPLFVFGDQLYVFGSGYVVAKFTPVLYAVSFVSTSPVSVWASIGGAPVTSGETVWLTAGTYTLNAGFNTGNAAFQWSTTSDLAAGSPTAPSTTLTVSGSGTVYATVDAVVGTPVVSATPIEIGTSVSFTDWADGFGSLAYVWNGLPSGCASADSLTLACTAAQAGSYSVSLTVTNGNGASVTSPTATLDVAATLVVGLSAAPQALDMGNATTLTATVAGGVAPFVFSYSGLPAGCMGSPSSHTVSCVPGAAGVFTTTVTVTDALGTTASAPLQITVNPPPALTAFSANRTSVLTGGSVTFTATVGGGTGSFSYAYSGLPAGCASADSATLSCTPSAAGTYTVTVVATDSDQRWASGVTTLVVNAPPAPANPTVAPSDLTPLYGIGGAALVVALIALVIALARGGRPKPAAPTPWKDSPPSPPKESPPTGASAWSEQSPPNP